MIGLLGMANNIVNVTSVLSSALSMSLVPSIARSLNQGESEAIAAKAATGVRLSVVLVMPAAAGLMVLAHPILSLIYGHTIADGSMPMAVNLLSIAAGGALFLSVVQTTNGILQGLGKVNIPMVSLGAGAAVKVVLNLLLVSNPAVGIYGAPIGTVACYVVAALVNLLAVRRYAGMRFSIMGMAVKPLLATAAMAAAAYLVNYGVALLSAKAAVLAAIAVAVPVYFVVLIVFKGIAGEELQYIPGGRKIAGLFKKLHLL